LKKVDPNFADRFGQCGRPIYCSAECATPALQHPQTPRFLQILRETWPMPLSLLNHSALALFAQRTRIPTSARSIGFCVEFEFIAFAN